MTIRKYKPFINLGPGDVIREEIEYYGWGKQKLASELGLSMAAMKNVLHNRRPITPTLAEKLSCLFKQSPHFWVNLNTQYNDRLNKEPSPNDDWKLTGEQPL